MSGASKTAKIDLTLLPIEQLLKALPQKRASDLHISAGTPALIRVNGELKPLMNQSLTPEMTKKIIFDILPEAQKKTFQETGDIDFSYEIPGVGRFRGNVLQQRNGCDAVFRYIPPVIPPPGDLRLPAALSQLVNLHQGLVLITGGTRSGKTTTLASMIQEVNKNRAAHVLTIEDPIEFIYPKGKSLINQREVGKHTQSTANALKAALREDPDIIVIGEMRDLETIQLAISASETGHLVVSTLQTQSAPKTLDRILDSFPAGQVPQIRSMLSESLRGVISQQLLKRADGTGMVLATEVLLSTLSLSTLIREGKTFQIPSIIQTGSALGMKKMDDSINELLWEKLITEEEAKKRAHSAKNILAKPPLTTKVATNGGN